MKYAIVGPDGMADRPLEKLGGRTPLEAADTSNMDKVAATGIVGMVNTIPKGMAPGSDIAIMSLLGYDPDKFHPGRASLEAANLNIDVPEGDAAFRCNLVTVSDGIMEDYSAGQIGIEEATVFIDLLNEKLGSETVSFHLGTGYRHIMFLKGGAAINPKCTPPHDILGKKIIKHLPHGKDSTILYDLMERSAEILGEHEINRVRLDLGENPANMIWLWGMGRTPHMPMFKERFKLKGAAISAVDLVNGMAKIIGWDRIKVKGATATLETNYEGKGDAAIDALSSHDIVFVHIEAPDEAGHEGNIAGKVNTIHEVDAHIVGPLLRHMAELGEYRLMVLPDHPTPIDVRTHTADPVPFTMCGSNVAPSPHEEFSEKATAESNLLIDPGHELMEYFLHSRS